MHDPLVLNIPFKSCWIQMVSGLALPGRPMYDFWVCTPALGKQCHSELCASRHPRSHIISFNWSMSSTYEQHQYRASNEGYKTTGVSGKCWATTCLWIASPALSSSGLMAPHKVTGMVAVAFWKTPMLGTRNHATVHSTKTLQVPKLCHVAKTTCLPSWIGTLSHCERRRRQRLLCII